MDITITLKTDDVAQKLQEARKENPAPEPRVIKIKNSNSSKLNETMELLKKRLSRESNHIGGSV